MEIKEFEVGKVYKRWSKLQNKGKLTGLIKVEINVTEKDAIPFSGEIIEEKTEFRPSEKCEFNVHIIKASELIKNTKLGYYKLGLELISDKPEKKQLL